MTLSTVTCLTLVCDLFIIGQGLCGESTFWKFQSSIEDLIDGGVRGSIEIKKIMFIQVYVYV